MGKVKSLLGPKQASAKRYQGKKEKLQFGEVVKPTSSCSEPPRKKRKLERKCSRESEHRKSKKGSVVFDHPRQGWMAYFYVDGEKRMKGPYKQEEDAMKIVSRYKIRTSKKAIEVKEKPRR